MARKFNVIPNSAKDFDPSKQLVRGDIVVNGNMLVVKIKWSKTRQFGHSRHKPLSSVDDSCLCPVTADKIMVSLILGQDSDPAFCINSNKNRLIPITYSKFQKKLKKKHDQ